MSIVNDKMSDTPEWYVTEYPVEGSFAVTDGYKIFAQISGGKTVGDECDLASRIAKLPDLERERDDLQKAVNGLCDHFGVSPANTTLLAVEVLRIQREREEAITRRMETIMQCELYEQERDEAREALKAFQPLEYHDCSFYKDIMGNCIICKNKETK